MGIDIVSVLLRSSYRMSSWPDLEADGQEGSPDEGGGEVNQDFWKQKPRKKWPSIHIADFVAWNGLRNGLRRPFIVTGDLLVSWFPIPPILAVKFAHTLFSTLSKG